MSAPREITGPSLTKTNWAKMPVERQSGLFEWVRAAAPNTPSKYRVGAQHPPDKGRGWRGQWMIFHVFKLLEPIGLIPLNNSLHPISFWQQQQRKQLLQMNAVYVWCETRLLSQITTDKLMFIYTNIFQRQNKQLTDLKLEILFYLYEASSNRMSLLNLLLRSNSKYSFFTAAWRLDLRKTLVRFTLRQNDVHSANWTTTSSVSPSTELDVTSTVPGERLNRDSLHRQWTVCADW